jgi:protein dithiol oxidoreductase (disulfide-forming)
MSVRSADTMSWGFKLVLMVALALCVGACGRSASTKQKAVASQGILHRSAAAVMPVSASAQDTNADATSGQESDTAEDDRTQDRSDVSLEHLAALPADAQLPSGRWKPGVNYMPLVPAQTTNVAPGKVEVLEVFWLGCPHCYALEPFLQKWLKTKPSYVEFVRVPVMWGPAHRAHAKLFYTLLALGREDLVQKAFDTIQQHPDTPLVANSDEETLKVEEGFARQNGISAEDFEKAFNSFSVRSKLLQAEQLTQRYQVTGVPYLVIDGKYATDPGMAGSAPSLFQLIDDLAAAEHTHGGHS